MAEYYAVERSAEYLKHYGVKGMRWGVRKAARLMTLNDKAKKKGQQKLDKHYAKANKKLNKLISKTDVLKGYELRKEAPSAIGASIMPLAAGIGMPFLAKSAKQKMSIGDYALAGFDAASGAALAGYGAHSLVAGSKRTKLKGHEKAVKKVNNWQKEMKNAFKGTKYEKQENARKKFKDTYTLKEYGLSGYDENKKPILYEAPTVSVSGSSLVRDSNSKAKRIFKKRLTDPPVTKPYDGSKPWLGVESPSGRTYSAETVNKYLKIKKRKRK